MVGQLEELVRQGYDIYCRTFAGLLPVRQIGLAEVTISVYNAWFDEEEMQWECDEEVREYIVYALDLGTDGVAGHGYSEEVYWYFSEGYDVDNDRKMVIFDIPFLSGEYYRSSDRGLNSEKIVEYFVESIKPVINLSDWRPRTSCGCI